jgi:hypothetical protein
MIVKCQKTGKILINQNEIQEHSETFGVSDFEEIDPKSTKIFYNPKIGKICFTENELNLFIRVKFIY